jgi:hypothetical protein
MSGLKLGKEPRTKVEQNFSLQYTPHPYQNISKNESKKFDIFS